jgi:predicted phosphoadenosine phosphosulfate sulfurtransferase
MKIYKKTNVFDESLNRIRFLFDEFENVVVAFSGGKDSTIVLNLALKVAAEKNRLPLKVMFLDQEAEFQSVIDYMHIVMEDERVDPMWFQIPFKIFNATSNIKQWVTAWGEGEEHMREFVSYSYKENKYKTDRFYELFDNIVNTEFKGIPTALLGGVRSEESPRRHVAMTQDVTYKYITWGKQLDKKNDHYTFYPIYDWSYTDVWKAIHENNWEYTKVYDYQYMYGVPIRNMRVSNLHHETSINILFYLQDIEAETWNKLVKRMSGINTAGKLNKKDYFVNELPFMFKNWMEYRDYLTEHLVQDESQKVIYKSKWKQLDERFAELATIEHLYKTQVNCLLANDIEFSKIKNFTEKPEMEAWKRYQKNGVETKWTINNKNIKR